MERIISTLFVVAGLINLYPLVGLLGPSALTGLYGLPFGEPNLLVLMRHRAVLLGLVGLFLVAAALRREWQLPALIAGLLSMLSFVGIALDEGGYNARLRTVVIADVGASALLAVAGALRLLAR